MDSTSILNNFIMTPRNTLRNFSPDKSGNLFKMKSIKKINQMIIIPGIKNRSNNLTSNENLCAIYDFINTNRVNLPDGLVSRSVGEADDKLNVFIARSYQV